jgi:8-oxo-dGTP pyrophosphatase MutT (NUDIX family)
MSKVIVTSVATHHVSSGGFIFYKDNDNGELFTLLITNSENILWICKGHLEKNEDQISAALREFEEEMGFERKYLEYIGLLKKINYSYVENGDTNTKEVYINVFCANEKVDLSKNIGVEDITKIEWYSFDDALEKISYDRDDLIKAKEVFLDYLNDHKRSRLNL